MYMISIIYTSRHWKVMAGHWTIKLGIQTAGRNKSFQSLVFTLAELFCVQWKSSILSAKFDYPVACQNASHFAAAHDCETGLLTNVSRVLGAWSAFRVLFTWSRRTTCAKDHRLFLNLNLTHKLTRLENPITGMDLVSATDLKGAQPRSRIGQSLWSFYILPWRCSFLRLV